jgi:benzoylformate decarboxylase
MQHDLIFSVGGDLFTLSLPSDVEPMPEGMPVIQLDVDPWQIGKNYPAKVAILGDAKATLPDLAEALRRRLSPADRKAAQARVAELGKAREASIDKFRKRAAAEAGRMPITPLALVAAVAEATPGDAVVVDESISSSAGLRNLLRSSDPRSFFGLRGGGIGWGLPAALGVKLALPQRPVVALVGDGSAMYTIQSLWTAAHEAIPVVYVIFNNLSYRILKQRTHALKGFAAADDRYVAMDLVDPMIEFVELARSLGVPGEMVEKTADVAPALRRGLASGGPYLVDVRIDGSFKA